MLIYASCPSFFFILISFLVKEQTTNGKVPLVEKKKRGPAFLAHSSTWSSHDFYTKKNRDGILGPPISREEEMKDF